VAWDAAAHDGPTGSLWLGEIFGDDATFQKYRVTELLRKNRDVLRAEKTGRLILTGYDNFRGEHLQMHAFWSNLDSARPIGRPASPTRLAQRWVADALDALLSPGRDGR